MKRILFLAVLAAFAANCKPAAQSGGPEVWKCDFKGKYKNKDGQEVPFTWNVTWTETGETGTITGESTEAGAKSTTEGTCSTKNCKITETYTAGEDAGKKYYWSGDYTDAATRNENVYVTSFKGTFGMSETDRTSGGEWSAQADCKR